MMVNKGTFADTSPASAITTVSATTIYGLVDLDSITVYATLTGGTGGNLDVYLQTSWDGGTTWYDLVHFPQKAAASAATTVAVTFEHGGVSVPVAVGNGSVGTPAPAIAVNTATGWTFGPALRAVYVAGASTSAGAAQSIAVYGYRGKS
jgi:hypothetical protein